LAIKSFFCLLPLQSCSTSLLWLDFPFEGQKLGSFNPETLFLAFKTPNGIPLHRTALFEPSNKMMGVVDWFVDLRKKENKKLERTDRLFDVCAERLSTD
jgi:hypothetical protein